MKTTIKPSKECQGVSYQWNADGQKKYLTVYYATKILYQYTSRPVKLKALIAEIESFIYEYRDLLRTQYTTGKSDDKLALQLYMKLASARNGS